MKRVALVIGNAAYSEKPLDNPCNDAEDLACVLRQFGFEVVDCQDATNKAMSLALRDFREALYEADLGLFFFAGHGLGAGLCAARHFDRFRYFTWTDRSRRPRPAQRQVHQRPPPAHRRTGLHHRGHVQAGTQYP